MNTAFTASDGLAIAFDQSGEGPVLICLAGLTRNRSDFDYVLPHLASVWTIRMDYRGRGASDWGDPATYSIARESRDTIELMDHLRIDRAAILGTSRGGLIAMTLAFTAKDRLTGIMLNDIGPVIEDDGLTNIRDFVGRNPVQKTFAEAEDARANLLPGFSNVPPGRWAEEVRKHYVETPTGLKINYDPRLRDPVMAAADQPTPDLWPLFDAMDGLPLAALRGANSNVLSTATFAEMQARRPDMIAATVADRGHVPFLDEPESLDVVSEFLKALP